MNAFFSKLNYDEILNEIYVVSVISLALFTFFGAIQLPNSTIVIQTSINSQCKANYNYLEVLLLKNFLIELCEIKTPTIKIN